MMNLSVRSLSRERSSARRRCFCTSTVATWAFSKRIFISWLWEVSIGRPEPSVSRSMRFWQQGHSAKYRMDVKVHASHKTWRQRGSRVGDTSGIRHKWHAKSLHSSCCRVRSRRKRELRSSASRSSFSAAMVALVFFSGFEPSAALLARLFTLFDPFNDLLMGAAFELLGSGFARLVRTVASEDFGGLPSEDLCDASVPVFPVAFGVG
mmetsp:Transcript_44036/g.107010  ORF Transcript_44036/g.107010 Transcript_44036/m.107010 type:complete len:208 (-) Transcript_44036:1699-2322(-)